VNERTSRLKSKKIPSEIPPRVEPNQIDFTLVKAANQILELAGTPIPLLEGGMRTGDGRRVLQPSDAGWGAIEGMQVPALVVNRWGEDDISDFVVEVSEAADLTTRESQIVKFIVEGDVWGPHSGGYRRLALAVRSTPEGIRKAWARCRAKLVDNWAVEPLESTRQRKTLRKATEGDGFNI